jgi:hypothetical protein
VQAAATPTTAATANGSETRIAQATPLLEVACIAGVSDLWKQIGGRISCAERTRFVARRGH